MKSINFHKYLIFSRMDFIKVKDQTTHSIKKIDSYEYLVWLNENPNEEEEQTRFTLDEVKINSELYFYCLMLDIQKENLLRLVQ